MSDRIAITREGAVLHARLNRPEKKNALDRGMYAALIGALAQACADDGVGAVALSGAGGVFTAGADLKDFQAFDGPAAEFPALRFVKALAAFEKPLVAAVEGDAVGVGTTMLFHCDLVYAAPSARFKMPFVDLGLPPEAGASLLVPRRFGTAKAAQYLLLCESFDAAEALRLDLVNAVVSPDALVETALGAARRLAEKPRAALLEARRLLRGDPAEVLARIEEEGGLFARALTSPEARALRGVFRRPPLERFPTRRNRLVDKKSLQIQKAGAKSYRKSLSTFSDFALACFENAGGGSKNDTQEVAWWIFSGRCGEIALQPYPQKRRKNEGSTDCRRWRSPRFDRPVQALGMDSPLHRRFSVPSGDIRRERSWMPPHRRPCGSCGAGGLLLPRRPLVLFHGRFRRIYHVLGVRT
jgi:enoyl-CoA hydratase/carnithine racemase